jgi:hypothetical protein
MVMPVVVMRLHHAGRNALGRGDEPPLEAGRPDHAIKPAFKTKPIANHQRRIGQRRSIGWLGLKAMRILIRSGNGTVRNPLPADLARHIREDGKGSDNRKPLLCMGRLGEQQRRGAKQDATKHGQRLSRHQ